MSSLLVLESLRKHGLGIMCTVDPVGEYAVQQLHEFGGKKLKSVAQESPHVEDEDEKQLEELKAEFEPLTKLMMEVLGDKTENVIVSGRMADSPCVLTISEYGWSANMERVMKAQAQALRDISMTSHMVSKRRSSRKRATSRLCSTGRSRCGSHPGATSKGEEEVSPSDHDEAESSHQEDDSSSGSSESPQPEAEAAAAMALAKEGEGSGEAVEERDARAEAPQFPLDAWTLAAASDNVLQHELSLVTHIFKGEADGVGRFICGRPVTPTYKKVNCAHVWGRCRACDNRT